MSRDATPASLPRLLTLQELAQLTGLAPSSLRDLRARGHLPAVKLPGNRRLFFTVDDVRRLLDRSRERPETDVHLIRARR
jgi:hypothetical protein